MKIEELEKQLKALATETVEKALADRDAARPAQTATPVPVVQTKSIGAMEACGIRLQAEYAKRALAAGQIDENTGKMFVERAANLTATTGLELNGPKRSPELIQALAEKSILVENGCRVFDGYDTQLNIGRWGGFAVSATTATGSPSDTSASTADVTLGSYFGKAKMQVADGLLKNPNVAATLTSDLIAKLANFVDTMALSGSGSSNQPSSLKIQTASGNKVAKTANGVAADVLADVGAGLGALQAAGYDISNAFIAVKPAAYFRLAAARDAQGYAFPIGQDGALRILGKKVVAHSGAGDDAAIMLPEHTLIGLPNGPVAGVGMESSDLSSGTHTVFGHVQFDAKLSRDTAAYWVTGAGADADGWFIPEA